MPPSDALRRAVRAAAGAILPVVIAAALSAAPAPAFCDAPGARTLGRSVLPPLPEPPEAAVTAPAPPAFSGATSAAESAKTPVPGISEAPTGAPEAAAESVSATEQLAAARRETIAAARQVQEREQALAAIGHEINLLDSDADAGRRAIAESRAEQARLLGTIMHLARNPPAQDGAGDMPLVEQLRAEALMREADPVLRARLRALTGEIARIEALQQRIAAKKAEEAVAQQALAAERERLAAAVAHRNTLLREMLPPQGIDAALRIADTEREAKGIGDLIKRAGAAEESRGKQREQGRTGGPRNKPAPQPQTEDPTRPSDLRSLLHESGLEETEPSQSGGPQQEVVPPHPPLVPPVTGTVVGRGGEPGAPDAPNEGLSLKTLPGAAVVAPFDGKIVYAGPFRNFGRVLIIRHDRRYYSVLAGLGRVDAKLGDWVLAGEPVGAVSDVPSLRPGAEALELDETDPGRLLYYELRRDGRPIDPQPWLASVEGGHNKRNEKQKVGQ
ncbi:MAG: murein hydrolase activator EnvC [Alphaproteobacteria bacterium]